MILYELVTGQLPFEGPPEAVLSQVLAKVPEPPSELRPGLDAALDALCLKALAKKPEDRFASASAFAAALARYARPAGVAPVAPALAPPETVPVPPLPLRHETTPPSLQEGAGLRAAAPDRPAARRGLWLAVLMLLVAGVTGWLALRNGEDKEGAKDRAGPPAVVASLRLLPLGAVAVEPGKSQTVRVRIERTKCPGRVAVRLAEPSPGVTVERGQVADGSDEGTLELKADEGASPGQRNLRIEVTANGVSDRGDLRVTIPAAARVAKFRNQIGMEMVLIPAGKFTMGSPKEEKEYIRKTFGKEAGDFADLGEPHEVEITRPFYMGAFEVTQEQYEKVVGKNPSRFNKDQDGGPTHPVETVSWEEAVEFCKRLSEMEEEKRAGRVYRLPTEAEWEYACRGGAKEYAVFHFGNSLSSTQANFDGGRPYGGAEKGPYVGAIKPVGSYKPNGFGLYDMHGNVWEWCQDWYDKDYYKNSAIRDPQGPEKGEARLLRGGSWSDVGWLCRSANRYWIAPGDRYNIFGFRVVCAAAARAP